MKSRIAFAVICASLSISTQALAQSFTNGSLTGPIANGSVPTGWSVLLNSPDTVDPMNNVGVSGLLHFGATPSFSPDGGTWVGMGRDASFNERFGQSVSGFTAGQNYTVSWYASNFGYDQGFGYTNPNQIEFRVNGTTVGMGAMLNLGQGWFAQSLSFTATTNTNNLDFQLGHTNKSYMGIDGLSISSAATVVPEPATFVLMGLGLGVVGLVRRRRRA